MLWFILFCVILLASSFARRTRKFDASQYYVCGRRSGTALVSFSILASSVGGSATLGMAGLVWQVGTPGFWWLGAGVVGLTVLGLLFARKIRSTRAATMPELCQNQLGPVFRKCCAILIAISYIPIVAAQFSAQALVLASAADLSYPVALCLSVGLLFIYTSMGGQNAVIRSDFWQFIILASALLLILFFCLENDSGRKAVLDAKIQLTNSDFPFLRLAYFILILGSSFIVGPMIYGRVLSAKSQRAAQKACLISAFGLFCIAMMITLIGLALRGIIAPESTGPGFKPEDVLNLFITNHLSSGISSLCLAGLFAAIVSSADSCLFTAASICANDLLKRQTIGACRFCMAGLTLAALALSFQGKGLLDLLFLANDIYVCGVIPPIFLALLFYKTAFVPQRWLLFAMSLGGLCGALASLMQIPVLSIIGLLASFLVCLQGYLLTRRGLTTPQ